MPLNIEPCDLAPEPVTAQTPPRLSLTQLTAADTAAFDVITRRMVNDANAATCPPIAAFSSSV